MLHYRRNRAGAETLRRDLRQSETLLVQADLTRESGARRMFAAALKKFGGIDTLVANAGDWETRDVFLHDMTLRQWRRTLDGVLTSTFLCLREFLRIVKKRKQGNAVLIGSTAAVFGEAGHADYAAGKAALTYGLTRSLKNELARLAPHTRTYCGGRINCVCPGWTAVPRLAAKLGDEKTIRKIMDKTIKEKAAALTLDQFVQEMVLGKIASDIYNESKAVAPLRHVGIRKSKLVGQPNLPGQAPPAAPLPEEEEEPETEPAQ